MRIRQPGPGGPIRALVIRVDLADPAGRAGLLSPGKVAAVASLSAMARSARAIAAINGDFFDIGATGAPVGPMVAGGRLIKPAGSYVLLGAGSERRVANGSWLVAVH